MIVMLTALSPNCLRRTGFVISGGDMAKAKKKPPMPGKGGKKGC